MTEESKWGLGTRAIHGGQSPDPSTGAVMTPIDATQRSQAKRVGLCVREYSKPWCTPGLDCA